MSILARLAQMKQSEQAPDAALVEEYNATKRAHYVARRQNDIDGALFWGQKATEIGRQLATLQDAIEQNISNSAL